MGPIPSLWIMNKKYILLLFIVALLLTSIEAKKDKELIIFYGKIYTNNITGLIYLDDFKIHSDKKFIKNFKSITPNETWYSTNLSKKELKKCKKIIRFMYLGETGLELETKKLKKGKTYYADLYFTAETTTTTTTTTSTTTTTTTSTSTTTTLSETFYFDENTTIETSEIGAQIINVLGHELIKSKGNWRDKLLMLYILLLCILSGGLSIIAFILLTRI